MEKMAADRALDRIKSTLCMIPSWGHWDAAVSLTDEHLPEFLDRVDLAGESHGQPDDGNGLVDIDAAPTGDGSIVWLIDAQPHFQSSRRQLKGNTKNPGEELCGLAVVLRNVIYDRPASA